MMDLQASIREGVIDNVAGVFRIMMMMMIIILIAVVDNIY